MLVNGAVGTMSNNELYECACGYEGNETEMVQHIFEKHPAIFREIHDEIIEEEGGEKLIG